jgi:hypothetical protein
MTDIWIVTSGEYSSYSVDAAFTTMEAADAWAARMNANRGPYQHYAIEYIVERIDLDPLLPELVKHVVEEPKPRSVEIDALPELLQSLIIPKESE